MSRPWLMRIALIVSLTFAAAGWHRSPAQDTDQAGPLMANARARRLVAIKTYEALRQHDIQEPGKVPHDFVYAWSVRRLHAERDFSRTKAERIAAFEGHLK